jgi:hypothetical protein
MMFVRGISVKSVSDFVRDHFPERYIDWLDILPQESYLIYSTQIFNDNWYPLVEAIRLPVETIAEMFYDNNIHDTAWLIGAANAEFTLTGVYRSFIQLGKPQYLIQRATSLMNLHFKPATLEVIGSSDNSVCLHITQFEDISPTIEYIIGGWIHRALEITGCSNPRITIPRSLTLNDNLTEYLISWQKTDIFNISALRYKKIADIEDPSLRMNFTKGNNFD